MRSLHSFYTSVWVEPMVKLPCSRRGNHTMYIANITPYRWTPPPVGKSVLHIKIINFSVSVTATCLWPWLSVCTFLESLKNRRRVTLKTNHFKNVTKKRTPLYLQPKLEVESNPPFKLIYIFVTFVQIC